MFQNIFLKLMLFNIKEKIKQMNKIKEGDTIPDFKLKNQFGERGD
jgi:hypothetical protein